MTRRAFVICHLSFVLLAGCASSQQSSITTAPVTAELTRVKFLHTFADGSGVTADQFGNIYGYSLGRNLIVKFNPNGDSLAATGGPGSGHYQFLGLFDADARLSTAIFIADSRNHRIEQYTKDLAYVSTLTTRDDPDPAKRFGFPIGVAVDDAGNIYIADAENKRVVKARPDFTIDRAIGGYTEATRPDAILTRPERVAVGPDEHLYVLDAGDNSIVSYDNLGNFLARRSLGPIPSETNLIPTRRVVVTSDTVMVFSPDEVKLFQSKGLTPLARWTIQDSEERRWRPTDMAIRNGAIYVMTPEGLCQYAATQPLP